MTESVNVVFDGQCPVCSAYCETYRRTATRSGVLAVELIDAREDGELMQEITARGWDIDDGMVVAVGDDLYYGAEAIQKLAELKVGAGAFAWLNRLLFIQPARARFFYPLLRACRNVLLRVLGRRRINNLKRPGNNRF